MQPDKNSNINGPRKVLDAPITLSSMNTPIQDAEDMKSIWVQTRDDTLVNGYLII